MNITLERFAYTPMGTFGRLRAGNRTWYTVEKPWRNNAHAISCIPEGKYKATRYNSPTPGRGVVWQFDDVPNRENVQIHVANTEHDVIGCIGLGTSLGCLIPKGEKEQIWGVQNSRTAVIEFMHATEDEDTLYIEITAYKATMQ